MYWEKIKVFEMILTICVERERERERCVPLSLSLSLYFFHSFEGNGVIKSCQIGFERGRKSIR